MSNADAFSARGAHVRPALDGSDSSEPAASDCDGANARDLAGLLALERERRFAACRERDELREACAHYRASAEAALLLLRQMTETAHAHARTAEEALRECARLRELARGAARCVP